MTESPKPRHIRDIAHLYLSRLQSPSRGPRATILITADSKRCFPGFHSANIAAAFASKRLNTSLFELSGLLPNGGYFLALPPHRYIRWNSDENDRAMSGMAGIKICYSLQAHPRFGSHTGRPQIDLIHLPPVSPRPPFQSVLESIRDFVGEQVLVLFLGMNAGTEFEFLGSATEGSDEWTLCCVGLDDGFSFMLKGDRRVTDLGRLGYWQGRLNDRIPIVIRIPESALARTYSSICDTILFRINQSMRKAGALRAGRISRTIQPG